MYGYIIGRITKINPKYVICENNQIGYILIVPNPYNYSIGTEYKIFTYQHVREDEISLYGFLTEEEKDLFLKLISVSGIGPKSALSILATGSVNEIVRAIEARDDKYLKKFPGIGAKASLQIILDLKGKLNFDSSIVENNKLSDVKEALISLGYSSKEIDSVLKKLDDSKEINVLVKDALKLLVK
jgi:Holliday junction DNA helicase RuvA